MEPLYFYSLQRVAVFHWAAELGIDRRRLRVVHDVYNLQGCRAGAFIEIPTHPAPVPKRVWEYISLQGIVVIRIDDSYARARHAREHSHAR